MMTRMARSKELIERKTKSQVRHLVGGCSLYINSATDIFPTASDMTWQAWEMKFSSVRWETCVGWRSKLWAAPPPRA